MSLDNINIDSLLLQSLYSKSLIKDENVFTPSHKSANGQSVKFLGANARHIVILVNEKEHLFLKDEDLKFLIAILNACGVNLHDVALVNSSSVTEDFHENLISSCQPEIILFLGTTPDDAGFPVHIPNYQVQHYNKQQYLCAPSLPLLAADKEEKKKLWMSLKTLFGIA